MNLNLETKYGKLSYSISGTGFPILLLAGGPGISARYLDPLVQRLSVKNKVILMRQRGTNAETSLAFNPENIKLDIFVEDIEDLRKHLSIKQWNILGHSWGGMLASVYCTRYKEAVSKLILINTAGLTYHIFEQLIDNVIQRLSGIEYTRAVELASKMMAPNGEQFAIDFFKIVSSAYFYDKNLASKFAKDIDSTFLNFPVFGLMMQDILSSELNIKDVSTNFSNPVLQIKSRQDIVGFQVYHDIIDAYPNLQTEVIEKAGHYCWLEQEDLFYKTINSFLIT